MRFPATPGWFSLSVVVCGARRWCVGGDVAGVRCGWSLATPGGGSCVLCYHKEGPYQDRPPLCPFRLLPLLIYSGSAIAFLKLQGPISKNIENVILLQP